MKRKFEVTIPLRDDEEVERWNALGKSLYGEDGYTHTYTTRECYDALERQLMEEFSNVCKAGGSYVDDRVRIKVEIEYVYENK